jgi:DNA processing protein
VPADQIHRRERLALLLTGSGLKCRRMAAALRADEAPLKALERGGAPPAMVRAARAAVDAGVAGVLELVESAGWRWIVPGDEDYPGLIGEIADPPLGLFVRGTLRPEPQRSSRAASRPAPRVAIVGSRRASAYGRQVARLLGSELSRAGVVVVSGMARGVDAAAHEGALEGVADTWAIWGTGPDRIYPPEHGDLAERIAERGALITEFPPGTPPRKHHFPQRNRLIAGLARVVVVVEATARSGALITARLAVDEGREVFAVPGNILSELSVGPNALLRVGARPMLTPRDVLEAVGVEPLPSPDLQDPPPSELLHHLEPGETATPDELAARSGRPIAEVLEELLGLELDGHLERQDDGRYMLVRGMGRGRG